MMQQFLANVDPFKRLTPAELQQVASVSRERGFAKGETVFRQNEQADAVWVVRTGRVHLMNFFADGRASTTCVMTPGETFCCLSTLDRKAYPVDAIAAVDSTLVRVPLEMFHQAMAKSREFASQTLCLFCDRLRQVEHKSCTAYEPAEKRIAQVLLTLQKKFGETIPLTRHELAELAGTTHETAIRTLSRFKQQGWIRSVRGKTTIVHPKHLSELVRS